MKAVMTESQQLLIRHETAHIHCAAMLGYTSTIYLDDSDGGYTVQIEDPSVQPYEIIQFLVCGALCELAYELIQNGCSKEKLGAALAYKIQQGGVQVLHTPIADLADWELLNVLLPLMDTTPNFGQIAKRYSNMFYDVCMYTTPMLAKLQMTYSAGARFLPDNILVA